MNHKKVMSYKLQIHISHINSFNGFKCHTQYFAVLVLGILVYLYQTIIITTPDYTIQQISILPSLSIHSPWLLEVLSAGVDNSSTQLHGKNPRTPSSSPSYLIVCLRMEAETCSCEDKWQVLFNSMIAQKTEVLGLKVPVAKNFTWLLVKDFSHHLSPIKPKYHCFHAIISPYSLQVTLRTHKFQQTYFCNNANYLANFIFSSSSSSVSCSITTRASAHTQTNI